MSIERGDVERRWGIGGRYQLGNTRSYVQRWMWSGNL
jgi:hypothetical protein